jgi:hypothetical protein
MKNQFMHGTCFLFMLDARQEKNGVGRDDFPPGQRVKIFQYGLN